tara:strand:+ start:638 stop:1207 length:570 start_codon:yes stop_codon:yes gene_type:complete
MRKIIVPIGLDCGIASVLKKYNLRNFSLPFDWTVTYNGVSDIIKDNFKNFLPRGSEKHNVLSNTSFIHEVFPNDYDKMYRRIRRFMDLFNSDDEIIFFRRGHGVNHHQESEDRSFKLKNDLEDCEDLYEWIKDNYPNLNFRIIVLLVCNKCFEPYKEYQSDNVEIYNISDIKDSVDGDERLDSIIKQLI